MGTLFKIIVFVFLHQAGMRCEDAAPVAAYAGGTVTLQVQGSELLADQVTSLCRGIDPFCSVETKPLPNGTTITEFRFSKLRPVDKKNMLACLEPLAGHDTQINLIDPNR